MQYYVTIVMEKQEQAKDLNESVFPEYEIFESENDVTVYKMPLPGKFDESKADVLAEKVANYFFNEGFEDFDIYINNDQEEDITEVTYDGDDFFEEYGVLWYNEDEVVDEADYQGRKVKLGKPMRGDVKKFKVYVKNPKGNVVKVNFGDANMSIKKSNPARRRSFRARHNCDNPGPRHKARYWSCRKW